MGAAKRDRYFDNLKGILILLVVIGHFLAPMAMTRLVWSIYYLIYLFHMPMLVMISGYFAKGIYRDGRFRMERVIRMLWLYVIFKIAIRLTEHLVTGTWNLRPINFLSEDGAPWYLLALVWWYLLVPVAAKGNKWLVMAISLLVSLFAGYLDWVGDTLVLSRTLSFAPFFYGGYYLKQEQVQQFVNSRWKWCCALAALCLTMVLVLKNNGVFGIYQYVVYGMNYQGLHERVASWGALIRLVQYVFALVMILGLMSVTPSRKTIVTRLGERSLQIYMLHRLVRDVMLELGFFESVTSQYRRMVVFVILLAIVITYLLSADGIRRIFDWLQRVPEWCMGNRKRKE